MQFNDSDPAWNNAPVIEEIANNTNEALDRLQGLGIHDVPSRIETNRKFFEEAGKQGSAWAAYIHNPMAISGASSNWMHLNRAILINPLHGWANVSQQTAVMHQVRYLSTGDPHHFLYHEMGHFLWQEDHPRRNPAADNQLLAAALPTIGRHISRRAAASPAEFVSEVFAQLVVGAQPVEPQVMILYQQLGGRVP